MAVKFLDVWFKREWHSLKEKYIGFNSEFGFFVTHETDIVSNNMIISMEKYWKMTLIFSINVIHTYL